MKYIVVEQKIRGGSTDLFVSFHNCYKPVSLSMISNWIERVLEESGIEISVISAHSTWAASSARDNGMAVDDILRIVSRSNAKVFHRFYSKVTLDN